MTEVCSTVMYVRKQRGQIMRSFLTPPQKGRSDEEVS
jgi:hypothetical protein